MTTSQNNGSIKILIVDDHPVVREGIRLLLESHNGLEVVGQAGNREDALELATHQQPDVVLLDLDLGVGGSALEFIPDIHQASPSARVLVFTGVRNLEDHHRAIQLGAVGLVLKDHGPEILIKAIEKVHAGEAWLDHKTTASFIKGISQVPKPVKLDRESKKWATLTEREREVVALLAEGLKIKDIANQLFISLSTTRNHVASIYSKLEVSSRFELTVLLFRHKPVSAAAHNYTPPSRNSLGTAQKA